MKGDEERFIIEDINLHFDIMKGLRIIGALGRQKPEPYGYIHASRLADALPGVLIRERAVKRADCTRTIMLGVWGGRTFVLDGHHRIVKGIATNALLSYWRLTEDQTREIWALGKGVWK